MPNAERSGLTSRQVQNFIDHGFVRIEPAFSADLAKQCRDELWAEINLSPEEPEHWLQPVIRVGSKASPPFIEAANTPLLHRAYDQLAGEGRWLAPRALGSFPIRFPSSTSPGDDGWHVDMSFGDSNPDFMEWRANVKSSGRALLMLFLFSDVGPDDAPTKIRKGSHVTIARELLPYGNAGATLRQLSSNGYASTEDCELALATGAAGTVYCATHFSFMPRNRTEGRSRASWHSRRCCRRVGSIRRCHPRRFRSPSARHVGSCSKSGSALLTSSRLQVAH